MPSNCIDIDKFIAYLSLFLFLFSHQDYLLIIAFDVACCFTVVIRVHLILRGSNCPVLYRIPFAAVDPSIKWSRKEIALLIIYFSAFLPYQTTLLLLFEYSAF